MKTYLLITVFGGIGCLFRFLVAQTTPKIVGISFPLATIIVNLLGCFLIGLFSEILNKKLIYIDENLKNSITYGFLGGFTTFSSFSQDFFNLMNNNEIINAFLYLFISVFFGLILFYLGTKSFF